MKVLLVEDNPLLGKSMKTSLEEMGWIADLASDGEEGLYLATNSTYDVCLVDRMLPKLSGIDMIGQMRQRGVKTPAIMITAMATLEDKVSGLEFADDYIVKPFEMDELIARVKALYRRSSSNGTSDVVCGDLVIRINEQAAMLKGTRIDLTAKEFDLLEALAVRRNHICSRQELCSLLYAFNEEPESNSLDVLLGRLRRKIHGSSVEIATVRSKGFVLRVD